MNQTQAALYEHKRYLNETLWRMFASLLLLLRMVSICLTRKSRKQTFAQGTLSGKFYLIFRNAYAAQILKQTGSVICKKHFVPVIR